MQHYFNARYPFGLPTHYRIGMSAGTQTWLDRNLHYLRDTKAHFRYVIFEPLLEPVTFKEYGGYLSDGFSPASNGKINLVIVGGESGANPRAMENIWAKQIQGECRAAGVAFFMKQESKLKNKNYKDFEKFDSDLQIREMPVY
jgi:protein gp37